MPECPPVLLVGWCRPQFSRQVLSRIRAAAPRRLYLGVDGINDEARRREWEEVRSLSQEVDWDCEVKCRYLESNERPFRALGGAMDWFFQNEEEGIILEDDCLPDPTFFEYCRQALEHYRHESKVMLVSGCNLCCEMLPEAKTRFCTHPSPWGWASWRRAWQVHDSTERGPVKDWGDPALAEWLGPVGLRLWEYRQKASVKGWVDSWDFSWQLDIIRHHGLCLHPAVNMIRNLGCGEDSTHTSAHESLVESVETTAHPLPVKFPDKLKVDHDLDDLNNWFVLGHHPALEENAADVSRDILECRQPAKDLRKAAREADKLARHWEQGTRQVSGLASVWKKTDARLATESAGRLRTLAGTLNRAAARLEGLVATRHLHGKSASGGKHQHGMLSFSQEGEDRILHGIFAGKATGFYVDVGAHHPYRFSNTWMFYQRGWSGINIDPAPGVMRDFHLWRPRDVNLEVGVAANPGEMTFHLFEESAYSTFSPEMARERSAAGQGGSMTEHRVKVQTLREILATHLPPATPIDFLSIDVEGLEMEVLEGMDWQHHAPRVILCEVLGNPDLESLGQNPVVNELRSHGYKAVASTRRTLIFDRV